MTIAGSFSGETVQEAGSLQFLANLSLKKTVLLFSFIGVCEFLNDTNLLQLFLPEFTTAVY